MKIKILNILVMSFFATVVFAASHSVQTDLYSEEGVGGFDGEEKTIIADDCAAWFDGCNNCSRGDIGGPAMCTMMACMEYQEPYCKKYFGEENSTDVNNQPPKNNNPIDVTQQHPTDPVSSGMTVCTMDVKQCDNGLFVGRTGPHCEFVCPGDVANQPTRDVTQKPCTKEYAPVCGQPPMPKCAEGMMCAQVMPALQTYANRCVMENADAEWVREGICEEVLEVKKIDNPELEEKKIALEVVSTNFSQPETIRVEKKEGIPGNNYLVMIQQEEKFLGIFSMHIESEVEIDVITKNIVDIKKPWYAFLVW